MLQIFTYSTGLSLTGRSAACAPAIATRPAAEPRRRLFTIFILNLQTSVYRERVPYPPSANDTDGTSPCSRYPGLRTHHLMSQLGLPLDAFATLRIARPGDAPLRRTWRLS